MSKFELFKNNRLAWASAEDEFTESPELLREGFYDGIGVIAKIRNDTTMLVIGSKGAGKTAIAKHLEIKARENFALFVNTVNLEDFPYSPFSKIIPGDMEQTEKLPLAWQWVLSLVLLETMSKDSSLKAEDPYHFEEMLKALREEGYLDSLNLRSVIAKSKKKGFSLSVMDKVSASYNEEVEGIGGNISKYTRSLQKTIQSLKTESEFIIFIDGLDNVLSSKRVSFQAIGALIEQTARFNNELRISGLNAKIVILCRDDVFARASGTNLNKLKQHRSVELNWYTEYSVPQDTQLFQLIEHKAKTFMNPNDPYFTTFYSSRLDDVNFFRALIEQTRFLPRDIFVLLDRIRESSTHLTIDTSQYLVGMKSYSEKYFYDEILDNIEGFSEKESIISLLQCISELARPQFMLPDLESIYKMRNESFDLILACKSLFECGALHCVRSSPGKDIYYAKYRNPRSSFNQSQIIVVHKALRKSLVLPLRAKIDEF